MAKLLSYYNICSISDQREFLGLAQDNDSGSVINTLGRNLFYTLQLSNQQQTYSWTVLDKLTNRVVYNFKTNKYVGIFGNCYVRCWDAEVKDINKVKKSKLQKNVADLLSQPNQNVIVLYTDGTCESLDYAMEPGTRTDFENKAIVDSQTDKILYASYYRSVHLEEICLYYFVKSQTGQIDLIYYKLDEETRRIASAVNRIRINRNGKVNLVGYTVVEGDVFHNLITIWSDKRIFMMPMKMDASIPQDTPGYFVSMLSGLSVDQPMSVIGIGKDCIAIYGANDSQDGGSLILFNTVFFVVQAKQYFKVYFKESRLWANKKHILLAFGQNLACVSYRISKEQLSDIIGSQYESLVPTVVDQECINEETVLDENFTYDKDRLGSIVDNGARTTNDPPLTNGWSKSNNLTKIKAFNTLSHFEEKLQLIYKHNLPIAISRNAQLPPDSIQMKFCTNVNDRLFAIDEVTVLTSELEKCGASEVEITDILIPILIKANLSNELVTCLRTYTNISDRRLVEALKYFIVLHRDATDADQIKGLLKSLNIVLSCSFNVDLIKDDLRTHLTFDDCTFILNYIYSLLESNDWDIALDETPQLSEDFDVDRKLLSWFSIILDSHFQQFILSKNADVLAMIGKWKELIDDYLTNLRDADAILPMLYSLVQGKLDTPDRQTSKWYSIESVKLF